MSMKILTILLPVVIQLLSLTTAEAQTQKPKFYRQRNAKPVNPKQLPGTPVVVNAASYLPGVSPGGLITIFGQNLTTVSGIVYAGTDPLPDELEGVSVQINGIYAPIFGVAYANGQDQISVQVPYETPVGPAAAKVDILNNSQLVVSVVVDSYTEDPGIFTFTPQGFSGEYAIAEHTDYSLVTPDNPAIPGDYITLYTTGLGPLTVPLVDGYGAPSSPPFAETVDPFNVVLDGENAIVQFSGLGPGFVGLYQINFIVPADAPAGDLNLQITSSYANSNTTLLPVR
jgi:uncharacterized protein (TIGR03437 family)